MRYKHLRTTTIGILAAAMGYFPASAEEPFICGTAHEPAVLAKPGADTLPRVRAYTGVLKAVVFRIRFADQTSTVPESEVSANNVVINNFYKQMSQDRFYWDFSIYPQELVTPQPMSYYNGNFSALRSWISTAVTNTGLRRGTDYAVYNTCWRPKLDIGWSGLSSGGTSGQNYMNGSYGTGVTAHEMGHTVGLAHAHAIEAGSTDFFGTPGTTSQHVEYGHPFDNMGRGGSTGHFNICYKYRDGWTGPNEVAEIRNTGLYRLYAHDNATHKGRLLGIRVPSGNSSYGYWFEYRTNRTENRRGASVMLDGWDSDGRNRADTWFMDMTPGTTTETDGVMVPGMEFKDKWGQATFRVTAVNAVVGAEGWVEVQVTIPGTLRIAPPLAFRGRGWDPQSPVFSLNGRQAGPNPALQTLVLRTRDGAPRLVVDR